MIYMVFEHRFYAMKMRPCAFRLRYAGMTFCRKNCKFVFVSKKGSMDPVLEVP